MRPAQSALGILIFSLVLVFTGTVVVGAPAGGTAPAAQRQAARTGTLVVTVRTPDGVPATVRLTSGRKVRVISKRPTGTSAKIRVKLPAGKWKATPQQVVDESRIFTGKASRAVTRVRVGRTAGTKVTYTPAPSISALQVDQLQPTSAALSWTSPSPDAEVAVRMAVGPTPPATVGAGTAVPVSGTTANASGLAAATEHSFSVFARAPGTTRWWGPVSTTVSTPAAPGSESVAAVTVPETVLVTQPAATSVGVTRAGVTSTLPPGVTAYVGQPWVLPPSSDLPGGFVGKVVSVSADGRTVTMAAGGLADAFDYVEFRVPDLSDLPVWTIAPDGSATRQRGGFDLDCDAEGDRGITLERGLSPIGSFNATLKKKGFLGANVPVGMNFDAEFGVEARVELSAEVSGFAECELEAPSLAVTIPGPVPMVMKTEPEATVGIYGEASMRNVGFSVRVGARVDGYLGLGEDEIDGEPFATAEVLDPVIDASAYASMTAGVEISVGPGLGNPKVGAMVGLSATLNALDANLSPAGGPTCLELAAGASASASISAKAWLGDWDVERSFAVPGLDEINAPYPGSPWFLPSGCSGAAEYRIAEGTLDVSHSWSGGCSGDQGYCDDGPDWTSSHSLSETSNASLRVSEPGEWAPQEGDYPAYMDAPMVFNSWAFSGSDRWSSSGWGCTSRSAWETTGPVQFGSAFWETGASALPGPDLGLDSRLSDYYWYDDEQYGQWTNNWWGWMGAWDTDWSNEFPRVPARSSWSWSGDCEGSESYDSFVTLSYLGPGNWSYPAESRRSAPQVIATPLEGCTPEACRWRVDGSQVIDYRSSYADHGLQGSGSTTMTWSYVIERRPPGGPDPAG